MTKTVTQGIAYAVADILAQLSTAQEMSMELYKTVKFFAFGVLSAPLNHYWYRFLDAVRVGVNHRYQI